MKQQCNIGAAKCGHNSPSILEGQSHLELITVIHMEDAKNFQSRKDIIDAQDKSMKKLFWSWVSVSQTGIVSCSVAPLRTKTGRTLKPKVTQSCSGLAEAYSSSFHTQSFQKELHQHHLVNLRQRCIMGYHHIAHVDLKQEWGKNRILKGLPPPKRDVLGQISLLDLSLPLPWVRSLFTLLPSTPTAIDSGRMRRNIDSPSSLLLNWSRRKLCSKVLKTAERPSEERILPLPDVIHKYDQCYLDSCLIPD